MNRSTGFTSRSPRQAGALSVLALCACASCVATHQYTHKSIPNRVELRDSSAHKFTYVNVTTDGAELVVYGKIGHSHLTCESAGHVDLAFISPQGDTSYFASIPIVRRNPRAPGWRGAAFRARLAVDVPRDHVIRLAFHGEQCVTAEVFDCRSSAPFVTAAPAVSTDGT